MGKIVIAAFRPMEGKEEELKAVIAERLPLLRRLGLATDRVNITMKSADGTILDVSEWVDDAAIQKAHNTQEVWDHWKKYEACCEYVKLDALLEVSQEFASFESVILPDV